MKKYQVIAYEMETNVRHSHFVKAETIDSAIKKVMEKVIKMTGNKIRIGEILANENKITCLHR